MSKVKKRTELGIEICTLNKTNKDMVLKIAKALKLQEIADDLGVDLYDLSIFLDEKQIQENNVKN